MQPLRARDDPGTMEIKRYSAPSKLQYYWNLTIRLFSVISRTLIGEVLLLCKEAVSVFYSSIQLDPRLFSVISRILIGSDLSLCREAVSVFYSPSWLGQSHWSLNLKRRLVPYLGLFLGGVTSLQICSLRIPQPQPTWTIFVSVHECVCVCVCECVC